MVLRVGQAENSSLDRSEGGRSYKIYLLGNEKDISSFSHICLALPGLLFWPQSVENLIDWKFIFQVIIFFHFH